MDILICIGVLIVGGIIGYHFAKMRYRADDVLKLVNLYADHMGGKITIEEFKKKFEELFDDIK